MGFTRREMLGRGALLAAAATMPAAALGEQTGKNEATAATKPLTRALFESLVGSSFDVTTNASHQYLTLLKVEDLPKLVEASSALYAVTPPAATVQTTGFVLQFSGGSKLLKQGTYPFKHESIGTFPMFIVPVGSRQMLYTAVFNQI